MLLLYLGLFVVYVFYIGELIFFVVKYGIFLIIKVSIYIYFVKSYGNIFLMVIVKYVCRLF